MLFLYISEFEFSLSYSNSSQGGLIEIQQDWQCNFDFDNERKDCFPSYTFKLLQSGDDRLSPGINYRYGRTRFSWVKFDVISFVDRFADKYRRNGIEYRTLTKLYGLRFVLTITGDGRKFDFYYLFLAVGMFLFKKCYEHCFSIFYKLIKDPVLVVWRYQI
jgi:hypothetical protein